MNISNSQRVSTKTATKAMRQFIKEICQQPVFKKLPGLYRPSPHGYTPYRELAAFLFAQQQLILRTTGALNAAICACAYALGINAPLLHLDREIGEAFLATAVPDLGNQIQIPLPCFILSLPQGLLQSDQGERVIALVIAHGERATEWIQSAVVLDPYRHTYTEIKVNGSPGNYVVAGLLSSGELEFLYCSTNDLVNAANRNLAPLGREATQSDLLHFGIGPSEILPELARLALNTILCLQHRPELHTEEHCRPRGLGFSKSPTYKGSIRWIGRGYQRRTSDSQHPSGNGTGKRPHWRRGHWHTVVHGAERALRRLQWFQPTYVNCESR